MRKAGHKSLRGTYVSMAREALPRSARAWITVLALLAFFFQNLAVQTHVHQLLAQPARTAAHHSPGPLLPKGQDPVDQCRLCQELAHAGHYLAPSAVIAIAQLEFIAAIFAASPERLVRAIPALAWRSRAPPRR